MSEQIMSDCKLWLGGYDLSGDMNAMALELGCELADGTTMGDGTRGNVAGLLSASANHQGLFEAGTDLVDDVLFSKIGIDDEVMSICPIAGVDGEVAYTFQVTAGEYSPAAAIGDAFAFSVSAEASSSPLVRGTVMHNNTRTATGNGAARQLGALTADQKLYAALHVLAVSGTAPTLNVTVESDDNSGMTSAVTQLTFTQAAAIGGQWLELSGALTDDWHRVTYTIGGTTPSFLFAIVLGIK